MSIKKYKIINERIKVVLPGFMASANFFMEKISFIKLIKKAFGRAMLESTTRAPDGFLPGLLLEEPTKLTHIDYVPRPLLMIFPS